MLLPPESRHSDHARLVHTWVRVRVSGEGEGEGEGERVSVRG